jgi:hypothetical protein
MFIALFVSFLITQPAGPAVCDQLSNEDVTPLIGPVKSKQPLINADTCVWTGDQRTLTILRTADIDEPSGIAMLEAMKHRAKPGDVVIDEPGIGQRAVSESIKSGQRVSIVAMAGKTSWTIGVDHVYGGMKPDELLPKLRVVAKKLVR